MSTPATPVVTVKATGTALDTLHLILLTVGLVLAGLGVYTYTSRRADAAEAKYQQAQAVANQADKDAQVSAKANQAFQAQTQAQLDRMVAANTALEAANEKLAEAITTRNVALISQQGINAKATPTEQSARWQTLVPRAIVTPTSTGFAVDAAGGLATLQQLEELPVLTRNVADLTLSEAQSKDIIKNDGVALAAEKAAHQADVLNDSKQLKASQDETVAVKAELVATKKKFRRTLIRVAVVSYIAGFATRVLTVK